MTRNEKRNLICHNWLAGEIHDALFDENNRDLASAYDDAILWIAELHLQVQALQHQTSAGFLRRDTSALTNLHPPIKFPPPPVDDGSWVTTGKVG